MNEQQWNFKNIKNQNFIQKLKIGIFKIKLLFFKIKKKCCIEKI